jgi:hypothetical protein
MLCDSRPCGYSSVMSELVGDSYGDDHAEDEAAEQKPKGTAPGEGEHDKPATTGTHRGWGDPQPEPEETA